MDNRFPEFVSHKIIDIVFDTRTIAYAVFDNKGTLSDLGGDFQAMGLPAWELGQNILKEALFLSGVLPLRGNYELIPGIELRDDYIVDAHLYTDDDLNWLILVDRSKERQWEKKARQHGNELRLLKSQIDELKLQEASSETNIGDPEFFEALNILAFIETDNGSFKLLKPAAERFKSIYPETFDQSLELYPQHKFEFIENFLIDAQKLWSSGENHRRISSGPWVEITSDKKEVALQAIAYNWEGLRLLLIEIQDESYRQNLGFLQLGRESVLFTRRLEQEVHKRTQLIRDREEEIALRLVCAADSRDHGESNSHIQRMGLYCELMAKKLDWNQNQIDEIRIAASMHDIGKIGVPDQILKKPEKLTKDEFEVMKLHTDIGAKILSESELPLIQMAEEIALCHHEKWDGSGYPRGLIGLQIPKSARIVALADVFDSLVHDRVYKQGISVEQAITMMKQERGSHFDPELFDLFAELKEEMKQIACSDIDPVCIDYHKIFHSNLTS